MRKLVLILVLAAIPMTAFAQPRDEEWRTRRYAPPANAFELTPTIGYRWGGTIFGDTSFLFGQDVDVAPSASFGISAGIPIGDSGTKLVLMANRQSSNLEVEGRLFEPDNEVADIDVSYLHAGVEFPFARSRSATPYFVVTGGLATLDPQVTGISAENRLSFSAGGGVKLPVSRTLGIKLEGRGYYTALEQDDCRICDYFYNDDFIQGEVNLGLVLSF